MLKNAFIILGACLLFIASPSHATTSAQVLTKNVSPRAEALGLAYTALSDDVYALYWNPAALSYMKQSEVNASFSSGLSDDYYGQLSYANAANKFHTWGVGLLAYSGGSFDEVDFNGHTTEHYDVVKSDWLFLLSGAYRFTEWWRMGMTVEFIRSTLLEKHNATSLAITLGESFSFNENVRLDIVLKHLGFPLSYGDESDDWGMPFSGNASEALPLTFQLGFSANVLPDSILANHDLFLAVGGEKVLAQIGRINLGFEYTYLDLLAFRGSYKIENTNNEVSLGAGINYPVNETLNLKLDYSFSFSKLMKDQHKIAFSFLNLVNKDRQNGAAILETDEDDPFDVSKFKLGFGIGREFGTTGLNFETMATDHVGVFIGIGSAGALFNQFSDSPISLGAGTRFYFGTPTFPFRWRLSVTASNGFVYSYYSSTSTFLELGATTGFEWRIFKMMSWNVDLGVAAGFPQTSSSYYGSSSTILSPAINTGLVFHIF